MKVVIFGAGIAGLTSAHELSRLGYKVTVYESNSEAGGFFRSARIPENQNIPSEYSWHGFGPWYHNTYDILKQIPFDESSSVYDKALSRPINFGIFPDQGQAQFYDHGLKSIPKMFSMSTWECIRWSWLMFKTWTSNHRTIEYYSTLNAAEQWRSVLSRKSYMLWRSCFGPWIGSDWTKVSFHTAGQFFRKQLISQPSHHHPADEEGSSWTHGARDGWLLLRGPSSEVWFEKWVMYLKQQGVNFFWQESLEKLEYDGNSITSAYLESGLQIKSDYYVVAANPFASAQIFARTPSLETENEIRKFKSLTQEGPHIQVSFRLAFSEPIKFPRKRTAVVVAGSEYNLTLFAQEQAWNSGVGLGNSIKSLWTGTSCTGIVPGRIFKVSVIHCTKEQFIEEVKTQILSCESLDVLIKEANNGRGLKNFEISKIEVWHEWIFSKDGIGGTQPKWVNSTTTQAFQPSQKTSIPNLLLAGAHTKTEADVWSIEGAVESGRRAAHQINKSVKVIKQYKPAWLNIIGAIDDVCFKLGLPNVIDLILFAILIVVLWLGISTF